MNENQLSTYVKREQPDSPRNYSMQLFKERDIAPVPDSELVGLIAKGSQHMKDEDLTRFLQAQKKFDGPMGIMETGETVQHWRIRRSLGHIPEYMAAAESAGLSYDQANDLLVHMLESEPYDFHQVDVTIDMMGRAYRRAAKEGADIPSSFGRIKDMVKLGAEAGVIDGCLYSFANLMRLGLSVDQAISTVTRISEAEGSASGYPMPYFNDAVKSMLPARVNPELVVEAFEYLGGERPWFNMGDYKSFSEAMIFGAPITGRTPNEMLTEFVTWARRGDEKVPLLESVSSEIERIDKEERTSPNERYFVETSGELEHAAQPYRNQRSLRQGVRDLEKLAVARMSRWEEVGEGMWAFDPKKEIWYSFGGELELPGMGQVLSGTADRVRHRFISRDISTLSDTPFLFHIHPLDLDCFITPSRESMAYPELRDDLTKFLTATPSRADYGVVASLMKQSKRPVPTRSFIAHARGVTEFTYPNDVDRLEDMSQKSRDIRDQLLLEFDVESYVWQEERPNLVQEMVRELDGRLPNGFGLVLHPTGTLLSS